MLKDVGDDYYKAERNIGELYLQLLQAFFLSRNFFSSPV